MTVTPSQIQAMLNQMDVKAGELKGLIRDANAATKDLRHALKDARNFVNTDPYIMFKEEMMQVLRVTVADASRVMDEEFKAQGKTMISALQALPTVFLQRLIREMLIEHDIIVNTTTRRPNPLTRGQIVHGGSTAFKGI